MHTIANFFLRTQQWPQLMKQDLERQTPVIQTRAVGTVCVWSTADPPLCLMWVVCAIRGTRDCTVKTVSTKRLYSHRGTISLKQTRVSQNWTSTRWKLPVFHKNVVFRYYSLKSIRVSTVSQFNYLGADCFTWGGALWIFFGKVCFRIQYEKMVKNDTTFLLCLGIKKCSQS